MHIFLILDFRRQSQTFFRGEKPPVTRRIQSTMRVESCRENTLFFVIETRSPPITGGLDRRFQVNFSCNFAYVFRKTGRETFTRCTRRARVLQRSSMMWPVGWQDLVCRLKRPRFQSNPTRSINRYINGFCIIQIC